MPAHRFQHLVAASQPVSAAPMGGMVACPVALVGAWTDTRLTFTRQLYQYAWEKAKQDVSLPPWLLQLQKVCLN